MATTPSTKLSYSNRKWYFLTDINSKHWVDLFSLKSSLELWFFNFCGFIKWIFFGIQIFIIYRNRINIMRFRQYCCLFSIDGKSTLKKALLLNRNSCVWKTQVGKTMEKLWKNYVYDASGTVFRKSVSDRPDLDKAYRWQYDLLAFIIHPMSIHSQPILKNALNCISGHL